MKTRSIATVCFGVLSIATLTMAPAAAGKLSKVHISAPRVMPFSIANSNARAAGLINADGSVAYAKGIKAVTNIDAGIYCVTLYPKTDATAVAPVLSFNFNSTEDFAVYVTYSPVTGSGSCPANSVGVVTYTTDSGSSVFTNEGFTIVVP